MGSFYCYLLECADGTIYCGWTVDLNHRLKVHQAGNGSKYTRARRPVRLVYFEELDSRSDAMKRENKLKKAGRKAKLKLAAGFPPDRIRDMLASN